MWLPITSLYAALGILVYLALAAHVSRVRREEQVGLGTGGNERLTRAVRAHGNTAEYLPLALIGLALLEIQEMGGHWLHLAGGAIIVGRFLHAWGLSRSTGVSTGRFVGTLLTWLALVGMAGLLLWRALSGVI